MIVVWLHNCMFESSVGSINLIKLWPTSTRLKSKNLHPIPKTQLPFTLIQSIKNAKIKKFHHLINKYLATLNDSHSPFTKTHKFWVIKQVYLNIILFPIYYVQIKIQKGSIRRWCLKIYTRWNFNEHP